MNINYIIVENDTFKDQKCEFKRCTVNARARLTLVNEYYYCRLHNRAIIDRLNGIRTTEVWD